MNLPIPPRSFFTFEALCPKLSGTPFLHGALNGWPEANRLPDLMAVDGREAFADVYVGWDDGGLSIGVDARGAAGLDAQPDRPLRGDGIQVWIDTRDVRNAHRASRYCHLFWFLPAGGGKDGREPAAGQSRIRRARAQSRQADAGRIVVKSHVTKSGFRVAAHLPADALTGFDPSENRRLGFTYLIRDSRLGRQYWTADDPLPVAYDPSLWGTLVLTE